MFVKIDDGKFGQLPVHYVSKMYMKEKYFTFFSRRIKQIRDYFNEVNNLVNSDFIKLYQAANFISKFITVRPVCKQAPIHFNRLLR